jgi:tRNA-modifying protein YgfZ
MTNAWTDFLQTQGANWRDGAVADFGDAVAECAAARDGLVLTDLSNWALIGFAGEEAQTFLHGQVTNDLRGLRQEAAVFAGYCSPKGRLLANFLAFRHADDILFMLPAALREPVQKRLTMFIMRSKVKARDASAEWVRLGLSGPGANALLAETLGTTLPAAIMACGHSDSAFAIRLGDERFDVLVRPEAAAAIWGRLATQARPVGQAAWDGLMVRAGIPVILPATQDQFVPQMANMDVLHGISFTKGCYPGQEIVARTAYLGKLKKRMFLAHVDADAQPGHEVYSPEFGQQGAGRVVNSAPAPEGGTDLLVVLQISSHEGNDVHLGALDGPRLRFLPLPYPV